jgi:prepilin-type N-terminal cleavage/methylation domain-containing protein
MTPPLARGFTLIELLVVIAIIGVLSSIVLAALSTARTKGADAARIEDVQSLETALQLYYNDNNGYPTSNGTANGDVFLSDPTLQSKLVPNYITSMPAQLITDTDHYYSGAVTTGVASRYDLLIYIATTNTWCTTGVPPNTFGDWGVNTNCKF